MTIRLEIFQQIMGFHVTIMKVTNYISVHKVACRILDTKYRIICNFLIAYHTNFQKKKGVLNFTINFPKQLTP
jgi:hypothetical protein